MEDIIEEWLKGIFFYEIMRYEDGVSRRYHRRSDRGVPHEFRPGYVAEDTAFPDNDGEPLGDDEQPRGGGSIDKRGRFVKDDAVKFMGASVSSSTKAPRRVPAPPVAGGRSATGMGKVRQLADALLDGEPPASLDSQERPPVINPRPQRVGVPEKLSSPAPVEDGCGGLLSLVQGGRLGW